MKAISIQQPFAYEILSGEKTIDVREYDTLERGDVLICASAKPAFAEEEMEELEEEYGCAFLYGHALCVANLRDVRLMRKGDEEKALLDSIDPEAYSWVLENIRPIIPFAVKGREGVFDVDDKLVQFSPFKYNEPVAVREGTLAEEFGVDFSGWHGRASDILPPEEGEDEARIHVVWDSVSIRSIPVSVIEQCVKEGFDWTGVLLRLDEIEKASPRDSWEDVWDAIEAIVEEHPEIFEE